MRIQIDGDILEVLADLIPLHKIAVVCRQIVQRRADVRFDPVHQPGFLPRQEPYPASGSDPAYSDLEERFELDILFVEIVFSVVVVEVEVASAGYGDAREYDDAHDQDQTQQGKDKESFRSFFHRVFLLSSGGAGHPTYGSTVGQAEMERGSFPLF